MAASVHDLTDRFIDAIATGELTVAELFAKGPPSKEFLGQAWRFVLTMLRERHVTKNLVRAVEILCTQDPDFTDGSFVLGMANYAIGKIEPAKRAFEQHCDANGSRSDAARGMLATIASFSAA